MSKHKNNGRTCALSGKKAQRAKTYSFLRSHYNPTGIKRQQVNLQTIKTFDENGQPIRIKISTSVLKRIPDIKLGINRYYDRMQTKRQKGKTIKPQSPNI